MALDSNHFEIYCTIENFLTLKEPQFFFVQTPNEVLCRNSVVHIRCSN